MSNPMSLAEIEAFWRQQASAHGDAPEASWSDIGAMQLELRELLRRVRDGDRVLDVGCANGYTTMRLAAARRVSLRGIDYVPEMIESARRRWAELAGHLAGRAEFAVGDVLNWHEAPAAYDVVVSLRVLINLRSWENQQRALGSLASSVCAGGRLLISEATIQGLARLNGLRARFGLSAIPVPGFNEYLDEDRVAAALAPDLELVERVDFASSYYLGTRVVKPLLARIPALRIDPADPRSAWNRWSSRLPAWGNFGTQQLFVFRRVRAKSGAESGDVG